MSCKSNDPSAPVFELTAPTNLVATAISARQIELTWRDNSGDETGFRIERRKGQVEVLESTDIAAPNATRFRYVMLDPNTLYFFRVQAIGGSEESNFTEFDSTNTLDNLGPWVELQGPTDLT